MSDKTLSRIHDPKTIDTVFVRDEISLGKEVIIQFQRKTYTNKILSDIDTLCSSHDDNLCIRFYDHESTIFDCETLRKIPHVKSLNIDCLQNVKDMSIL